MSLEEKDSITMEGGNKGRVAEGMEGGIEGREEDMEGKVEEGVRKGIGRKEKKKLKDNLSFLSNKLSSIDEGSFSLLLSIGLGFGVAAIIISFIVGIFSGISFLTILFRMLLVGVIFSFLGFGIALFLKYFVPDIFVLFLSSPEEEDTLDMNKEDILGSNLDYTIEENSIEDDSGLSNNNITKEPEDDLGDYNEIKEDVLLDNTSINKNVDLKGFNISKEPKILAQAVKTAISKDS